MGPLTVTYEDCPEPKIEPFSIPGRDFAQRCLHLGSMLSITKRDQLPPGVEKESTPEASLLPEGLEGAQTELRSPTKEGGNSTIKTTPKKRPQVTTIEKK